MMQAPTQPQQLMGVTGSGIQPPQQQQQQTYVFRVSFFSVGDLFNPFVVHSCSRTAYFKARDALTFKYSTFVVRKRPLAARGSLCN